MTTKSILKHPYWLPPENGKRHPHYERFCVAATKYYRDWLETSYALGQISWEEFDHRIHLRLQDIPGSFEIKK